MDSDEQDVMKYFGDAIIGESIRFPETYHVTEANIIETGQQWDPIPIHIDKTAAEASYFGGLVASTVQLFAIATKLSRSRTDTWAVVSALSMTDMISHAPARPGDTLYGTNTFTAKRLSNSKPNMGIIDYKCELFNQTDERIFEFSGAALYKTRH